MHNLKEIRKNFDIFKERIKSRNIDINFENLFNLDKLNREFINKKEILEQQKKLLSKSKDEDNFKKSKNLSIEIDIVYAKQKKTEVELNNILSKIPKIVFIYIATFSN